MLSAIAVFAISAGILLATQSGCIGATLAGTDGSYDTPDTGLSEHAPVQEVTAGERMTNLIVACQIADTFADMFFTGVLDVAYAVHAVLSLTAVDNITDDDISLVLNGASDITTFKLGNHTYAAVAAYANLGVQILNITDPLKITAAGNIADIGELTPDLELRGARGITTFESGGHTYAAVAAYSSDGVQILNITDPSKITAAGNTADIGTNTDSLVLNGARGITTFVSGGHTYAAVAAYLDNGVQILNITDPSNITAAGNITNTDTLELEGASGIATFESGDHTYVAVAAYLDNGVQILNITDPLHITAAGNITNTDTLELEGASGITTFVSGGHTYAAVAAHLDDGVQILNITDPLHITPAGSIDTNTLKLDGAQDITTFTSGGHTYVAVTANRGNGVQILDVTDPYDITPAGNIADIGNNADDLELNRPRGITTFTSGDHIYAAVAAYEDDGVQIIRIDIPESGTTSAADAFATTWTVSADQSITINFVGDDMDISWGDGTTVTGVDGPRTHIYTDAGNYTVSVTGGLTGLTLDRPDDSTGRLVPELASIDQWGGISWTNMSNAFAGASNMTYSATDTPDLRLVTDMSFMFDSATAFDGDLSSWDVSLCHRHGPHVPRCHRLQPAPQRLERLLCQQHGPHVPGRHLLQPAPQRLGRLLCHRHGKHVLRRHLLQPDPQRLGRLLCHLHVIRCSQAPLPSTSPISTTGTSRPSLPCSICSTAPPTSTSPSTAWDVSSVTDMNYMFQNAADPSTSPSTPGTSPLSPTWKTCSQAPSRL